MDTDVGVTDQGREVVHHLAHRNAFIAPVPGHPDMMELLAIDRVWPHTLGHQRLGLNRPAWRADAHYFGVVDPQLLSVLWADLHKELRLQLGQPGQPAAHATAEVV